MTQPDPRAAQRRRRMMRMVNVPMRAVLSLPFRTPLSGRLMLLSYTGRKSGKHYRQPLSYTADAGVLLTPGGGNWTLSLSTGTPVTVRLAGKDVRMTPEVVADPLEVGVLLQRMAELNPAVTKFVPLPRTEDGTFKSEPLGKAVAHGFRIVRWQRTT